LAAQPNSIQQTLVNAWYSNRWWLVFLIPLEWVFSGLATFRRSRLQSQYQGKAFTVPVAIVGNISAGGSGKTPLIIGLVHALNARGYAVGVVSRGYGGYSGRYPLEITPEVGAAECGDEPLLIAQSCQCPVVVDPERTEAVNYLLANHRCDLVLCDDGLQHYRLHRDVEIAVIDGGRGLGNERCLPAGPLRESPRRLREVDFVLVNGSTDGFSMEGVATESIGIVPSVFRHIATGRCIAADDWAESTGVHAVAAIGNPQRFATTLESLGLVVELRGIDDHQQLYLADISFSDSLPVIITAKDAVKYTGSVPDTLWVLEVEMLIAQAFVTRLIEAANLNSPKKR
jgi:tetraacyldisaccharide 4'-kinase